MKEHWRRRGSDLVFDAGIFRLRRDDYEYRGRPVHPFYVLESNPWTNVVAVTEDGGVVLVRQFRHGLDEVCLEVPGGVVDAPDEDPATAAARELREETGYAAPRLELLGAVSSNPAILDNRTYCFLAAGARRLGDPTPEAHEDLAISVEPLARIPDLIASGEIHHALSVCALSLYLARFDA